MTMSWIRDKTYRCVQQILSKFESAGTLTGTPSPFINYEFVGPNFRRAHLSIVDKLETNKIWMMHCCIFPNTNDSSPIFGFDIIAGPSRISGAFHDFSMPVNSDHPMSQWFSARSTMLQWKKTRELPAWANMIFSKDIIAIGSVDQEHEVDQLIDLALTNLDFYLRWVGNYLGDNIDSTTTQNMYCHYQKQNPHNIKSLVNLGLTSEEAEYFVNHIMFPEI